MEKYFIIIPFVAIATVIMLTLVQVLFIKWTDKLFGINKNEQDKKKDKEKESEHNSQ